MRSRTVLLTLFCVLGFLTNCRGRSPFPGQVSGARSDPVDTIFCDDKKDGTYAAEECGVAFIGCLEGKATRMECSRGLFFNPETAQCDYKENIRSCKDPFDCTGRDDGAYANGCTSVFWYCSAGTVAVSRCPSATFFDVNTLKCDYKRFVPACGGVLPSEAEAGEGKGTGSETQPEPTEASEETTQADAETTPSDSPTTDNSVPETTPETETQPDKSCPADSHEPSRTIVCRKDGPIGLGCSRGFWICSHGVAVEQLCPSELVYSSDVGRCAQPEDTRGCEHIVATRKKTAEKTVRLVLPSMNASPFNRASPTEAPNVLSNNFPTYSAKQFRPTVAPAASSRVEQSADQRSFAPVMGKPITRYMGQYKKQAVCKDREDGRHMISPCSDKCLLCMEGKGVVVKCASGEVFSSTQARCVPINQEPGCVHQIPGSAPLEHFEPKMTRPLPTVTVPEDHGRASCSVLPDGPHEMMKCNQKFVYCINGATSLESCQKDLVFNAETSQCDFPGNTPSCGSTSWPPVYVQPLPTAAAQVSNVGKCANKLDGNYVDECSEKYYACSNGLMSEFVCPHGLVFNVDRQFCDHRDYVKICGASPVVQEATTKATISPSKSKIDTELVGSAGCSNRKNGVYALEACSSAYVYCWNGHTSLSKCTNGLVFNSHNARCDFRYNNKDCPEAMASQPTAATIPTAKPTLHTVAQDPECAGQADGVYAQGCSRTYFSCVGGGMTRLSCQVDLVFDAKTSMCLPNDQVDACRQPEIANSRKLEAVASSGCAVLPNGAHPLGGCLTDYVVCYEGTTRLSSCSQGLLFNPETSLCDIRRKVKQCSQTATSDKKPSESKCMAKADGVYSGQCSASYLVCSSEVGFAFACPEGLIYDSDKSACDYMHNVAGCKKTNNLTPTMASKDIPIVLAGDCAGKPDGNYANGQCASQFYACSNGVKTPMMCPGALVFDVVTGHCDHLTDVPACKGGPAQPAAQSIVQPTAQPLPTALPTAFPTPGPMYDMPECQSIMNGIVGQTCDPFYILCSKGRGMKVECPEYLNFVESRARCEYQPSECTNSADSVMGSAIDCSKLVDGSYSLGCIDEFISCSGGQEHRLKCPSGTVFDGSRTECVRPEECGKSPKPTALPLVMNETPEPQVAKTHGSDCTKLANGPYSAGCTNEFFMCTDGRKTVLNCPKDLLFDNISRQCVWPDTCATSIRATPPTFKEPVIAHTVAPPTSVVGSGVDCTKLADGAYAPNCSPRFTLCSNHEGYLRNCPKGLVFDAAAKRCDYPSGPCVEPSVPHLTEPAVQTQKPTVQTQHTSLEGVDCASLKNGDYSSGCTRRYISCVEGFAVERVCQEGLVFDSSKIECVYPETCASSSQPAQQSQVTVPQNASPIDCSNLPGGLYGAECASSFVVCWHKGSELHQCPYGLVFSPSTSRCAYPSAPCSSLATPFVVKQQQLPEDQICSSRPDGVYGSDCSEKYIECARGVGKTAVCPQGMVFSIHMMACDLISVACPAKAMDKYNLPPFSAEPVPSAVPTSQSILIQPSTSGSVDCSQLANGVYGTTCATMFVQCSNGRAYSMECPAGLVFNSTMARCERLGQGCIGGTPEPTPALQQPIPTPQSQVWFDCSNLADGMYAQPCSTFYAQCSNGRTFTFQCPKDLVYDLEKKRCDYPRGECIHDGQVQQPQDSRPYTEPEHPREPTEPRKPAQEQIQPPKETGWFDCSKLADGIYAQPCSTFFAQCSNKETFMFQCPSGLVYDIEGKRCDYPKGQCIHDGQVKQPQDSQPLKQSVQPQEPTEPRKPAQDYVKSSQEAVWFDCSQLTDGMYAKPCSSFYTQCSNGRTFTFECSRGLVYDIEGKRCDYPKGQCIHDGAVQQPQDSKPYTKLPQEPVQPQEPRKPAQEQIQPPKATGWFDCSKLANGIYSRPCATFFAQCSNGETFMFECPRGLVYDLATKQCEYPKGECIHDGGVQQQPQEPMKPAQEPTAVPLQKIPVPAGSSVLSPSSVIHADRIDCALLQNGLYGVSCSVEFVECWDGRAFMMRCSTGFCFDSLSHRCDKPDRECPDRPASHPADSIPGADVATADFCKLVPNGDYSSGCQEKFVTCVHGTAVERRCARGLVFDSIKKLCVWPDQCHGISATTQTPQLDHSSIRESVDCSITADGRYGEGCATWFVVCIGGRSVVRECSRGKLYSVASAECEIPEAFCQNNPIVTPAPTQQPSVTQQPALESHVDCGQRADGDYSMGCVRDFVTCVHGVSLLRSCAETLVYDGQLGRCVWPMECGQLTGIPHASPLPQQQPTALPEHVSGGTIDCTTMADGSYSLGCFADFITCFASRGTRQLCPQGLVFDTFLKRCVYEAECHSAKQEVIAQEPLKSVVADSVPLKQNVTTAFCTQTSTVQSASSVDCSRLLNGAYAVGCSSTYVVCADGIKFVQQCPNGLVFIVATGICDWPSKCDSQMTAHGCPQGMSEVVFPSPSTAPATAAPQQEGLGGMDCSNLPDGVYGSECSSTFTYCSNGRSTVRTCPAGLVFDQATKRCDWPLNCAAQDMSQVNKDACSRGTRRGKQQCGGEYEECVLGVWQERFCPSTTIFDVTLTVCVWQVDGCPQPAPSQSDVMTMPPPTQPPHTMPPVVSPSQTSLVCTPGNVVPRGDCLATFLECMDDSKLILRHCAQGYLLDITLKVCRVPEDIPECLKPAQPTSQPKYFPTAKEYVSDGFAVDVKSSPGESAFVQGSSGNVVDVFRVPEPKPIVKMPPPPRAPVYDGFNPVHPPYAKSAFGPPAGYPMMTPDIFGNARGPLMPAQMPYGPPNGQSAPVQDTYRAPAYPMSGPPPARGPPAYGPFRDTFARRPPPPPPTAPTTPPVPHIRDSFQAVGNPAQQDSFGVPPPLPVKDAFNTEGQSPPHYPGNAQTGESGPLSKKSATTEKISQKTGSSSSSQKSQVVVNPTVEKVKLVPVDDKPVMTGGPKTTEDPLTTEVATGGTTTANALDVTETDLDDIVEGSGESDDWTEAKNEASKIPKTRTKRSSGPFGSGAAEPKDTSCAHLADGTYAKGCSQYFTVCSEGLSSRMMCHAPLKFNQKTNACDYVQFIKECEGLTNLPLDTTLETTLETKPETTSKASATSSECSRDENKVVSMGCSQEYKVCVHGLAHLMDCPQGLFYSDYTKGCDHRDQVPACGGSPTHGSDTDVNPMEGLDVRCTYSKAPLLALGLCRIDFVACLNGFAHDTFCIQGSLFDHVLLRCVPAEECGKTKPVVQPTEVPIVTSGPSNSRHICAGVTDGSLTAIAPCRNQYIVCRKGAAERHRCPKSWEVFDSTSAECVARKDCKECTKNVHATPESVSGLQSGTVMGGHDAVVKIDSVFCSSRQDGLYRDPNNCSKIIQCFGKDEFSYQMCGRGLVFNEVSGGCDYKSNVPHCNTEPTEVPPTKSSDEPDDTRPTSKSASSCGEKSHGDYMADNKDCSVYYRCVWGKLERMQCPETTAFNPELDVCDSRTQVQSCKTH